jgi:hypothetical protein
MLKFVPSDRRQLISRISSNVSICPVQKDMKTLQRLSHIFEPVLPQRDLTACLTLHHSLQTVRPRTDKYEDNVRFEVFTAVTMKNVIL